MHFIFIWLWALFFFNDPPHPSSVCRLSLLNFCVSVSQFWDGQIFQTGIQYQTPALPSGILLLFDSNSETLLSLEIPVSLIVFRNICNQLLSFLNCFSWKNWCETLYSHCSKCSFPSVLCSCEFHLNYFSLCFK